MINLLQNFQKVPGVNSIPYSTDGALSLSVKWQQPKCSQSVHLVSGLRIRAVISSIIYNSSRHPTYSYTRKYLRTVNKRFQRPC